MKTQSPVMADAPTTTLKIVHSYLLQTPVEEQVLYRNLGVNFPKVNPFKSLFVIHPSMADTNNWDSNWFNNYE